MKKKISYLVEVVYNVGNVERNTIIQTERQYGWKHIKYLLVNQLIERGYAHPTERKSMNRLIDIQRVRYNINEN